MRENSNDVMIAQKNLELLLSKRLQLLLVHVQMITVVKIIHFEYSVAEVVSRDNEILMYTYVTLYYTIIHLY